MRTITDGDWSRRQFLSAITLAGAASLIPRRAAAAPADPPPETKRIRLIQSPAICWAPQYMSTDLLRAEGFTDTQFLVSKGGEQAEKMLAAGEADLSLGFSARHIIRVDAGDPVVMLGGLHIGCFELFANERVQSVRDLKGRNVAVTQLGSGRHVFFASMVAHVGLDARKDINFVTDPASQSMRAFSEGKLDAFMAFAPEPQELRARKVGRVLVDSNHDRPWSQYFCCVVAGHREFIRKNPAATKRALRALLKGADQTANDPERAHHLMVERNVTKGGDTVRAALREIPYGEWRDYDHEDTVRFYALRLREAGMIRATPQKIIAQGGDWRFIRELQKELKG